jgi:DNA mismatch repair protein MutL
MGSIKVLPENLINKIAAGEVVERPASVVKELLENSIDAGADEIHIDILHGGKKLIRVSDNGIGMSKEDALLAFERHATSKIYDEEDLEKIGTMGFRGEAIPSIASVSKVLLITSIKDSSSGTRIEMEGGKTTKVSEAGSSLGTVIEIRDLFFNTPARLGFLKSQNTELSHIIGAVESEALGHPYISFRLNHNRKVILPLPKASNFIERIHQIYGRDLVENLIEIRSDIHNNINLTGYISMPPYSRADRNLQAIFVNKRPVKNQVVSHAISEGYKTMIMKDRHPVVFLFLEIDHREVDVNVHPTKREVRFRNPSLIHDLIVRTIRDTLSTKIPEQTLHTGKKEQVFEGVKEALERYMRKQDFRPHTSDSRLIGLPFLESITQTSELKRGNFSHVFESYIVTSDEKGITIIDQHAAHERILYEKLKNDRIEIQRLLAPEMIELSKKESLRLIEILDILKDFRIELEEFGDNTFIIRSIPAILKETDIKRLLLDILGGLEKDEGKSELDEIEKIRILMACHGAVRANQPLTNEEMVYLMEELNKTELPHTCPHGRPTTVKFTLRDLEKLFKRK